MALVKYNNNSLSSITSAASFPAGAMTLIKTITASSDSTISFVDGSSDVVLDSTYPIYMFTFNNIHPATDGVHFSFQGNAAGGSGFDETITSTVFFAQHREDDSSTSLDYRGDDDLAQSTSFQNITGDLGNQNDECGSGIVYLFDPSNTTFVKHFLTAEIAQQNNEQAVSVSTAGYCNVTAAIDAVQFKMSSGNIDSGTIKLYGLKDS